MDPLSHPRLPTAFRPGPLLLLPLGWMTVIFVFSSDLFSGDSTRPVFLAWMQWLFPDAGIESFERIHFILRKIGHLAEYAILSFLWYVAVVPSSGRWQPRQALGILGLCAAYAALDEWHQSFVPSRLASPIDVVIDIIGAGLVQGVLLIRRGR